MRTVTGPLQRFCPILRIGQQVFVFRYPDVREVMTRDEDFTIAEINGAVMDRVNGPFILGMDRSPQYLRERGILEQAVHPGDLERIRAWVRQSANDLVSAALPAGRIDVVSNLGRLVAVRLVATYFGVPGPDEASMLRWMRTIFHETFLNPGGADIEVRRAAERSAVEFHAYADDLIAQRKAEITSNKSVPDDFLSRLVRMQADPETHLSDEGIRRNIGGVVVGAVETTSKAIAHAVDELLRRPDALVGAVKAANADDIDTVKAYAFEALRFNPANTLLPRHAARTTVLAEGTRRQQLIRQGNTVLVALLSAMFDPSVFVEPKSFRTDHPDTALLHFGYGLHQCFGVRINAIQIPEVVAALLRVKHLRRAPGPAGKMLYTGPFPDRLLVDFDRATAPAPSVASPAGAMNPAPAQNGKLKHT